MMKKYLKKTAALAVSNILLLSLTACGSSSTEEETEAESADTEVSVSEEPESIPLSACVSGEAGEVWYLVENAEMIGKDSRVKTVYVFQDGTCSRYPMEQGETSYTLGDFAQMTDEEIISAAQASVDTAQQEELRAYLETESEAAAYLLDNDLIQDISISVEVPTSDEVYEMLDQGNPTSVSYASLMAECSFFVSPEYAGTTVPVECDNMSVVRDGVENYANEINEILAGDLNQAFCRVAVYTDSTGNNTQSEVVAINYADMKNSGIAQRLCQAYPNTPYTETPIEEGCYEPLLQLISQRGTLTTIQSSADVMLSIIDAIEGDGAESLKLGRYSVESVDITVNGHEYLSISGPINTSIGGRPQVYDSYYDGYYAENEGVFITRVEDGTQFVLDEPGAEGVEVDPDSGFSS